MAGRCLNLVLTAVCFLTMGLVTGCKKASPPPMATPPGGPTAPAGIPGPPAALVAGSETPAKPAGSAPTLIGVEVNSGEFFDAAKAIEAAAKNDLPKLVSFFDMNAMADKALVGVEVSEGFKKGFKRGAVNVAGNASLAGQIATAVQGGSGTYELLRVHKHGNQHAALFRMSVGGGLNYHDLKLVKGADGKIKVDDLFVLISGELMSTTFRQMILPVAANENRNMLEKLTKKESDYVTNFPKVEQLSLASRARDYDKSIEIYRSMPKSMQETKAILILRLGIASQTEHWDEVRAATADYQRLFPGDGTADLISLDSLILEKKFDEAIAAVDRIDKLVGGDPYLETFRTNINALKKQ